MSKHDEAEDLMVELRRYAEVDLSTLDRERLERLADGMLAGLSVIFDAISEETEQQRVLIHQQQLIADLTQAVSTANAGMLGTEHKELLLSMINVFPSNQDSAARGLYRAFRQLSNDGERFDVAVHAFWADWPQQRQTQEETEDERDEENDAEESEI